MRVAVVGAGISGLSAAFELSNGGAEVVIYEKEDYLGGHARTVAVDGIDLDLGFMVFNRVTYPNMMEFFEKLGVEMEVSDMSFSTSLDGGKGCEWGSRNGLASLFAQKGNLLNPYFWLMLREIFKFKDDTLRYLMELEENPDLDRNGTLELFIKSHGYSELFQKAYLVPICASIWSCPSEGVMNFSAYSVLSFCRNHHLLQPRSAATLAKERRSATFCSCKQRGLAPQRQVWAPQRHASGGPTERPSAAALGLGAAAPSTVSVQTWEVGCSAVAP